MAEEEARAGQAPPVRDAVAGMRPYVPGRSIESIERELGPARLVKMNQNENPLGPSPRAVEAIRDAAEHLHLYPEGPAPTLRQALAQRWNLPEDWVLVGNGSDEIFRLLAECYLEEKDVVVMPSPSFGGYRLVAELMGAEVVQVPLVDWAPDVATMASAARALSARLLFLCRPNSPTGGVFAEAGLRAAMEHIPHGCIVVLDEAYAEFDDTDFEGMSMVRDYPNLVTTRTFSKIYGLAGLRLGYGVMRPELMGPLLRARDPFSVNSLAVAGGIAALQDREHVERTLAMVRAGKGRLCELFETLKIDYVPTQSNFILFHTVRPAVDVYEDLLQKGVVVRPCTSFGLPHSIRVTIGTPEQNDAFAAALSAIAR